MVATLTLSSDCRTFIGYPESRKNSQPSNRAIFPKHTVLPILKMKKNEGPKLRDNQDIMVVGLSIKYDQ